MQDKHLFEYATIRLVPRVEREEFINVGIILYCSSEKFLKTQFNINTLKISAFCPEVDIEEVSTRLHAFAQICEGGEAGGPIGALPMASRFRWLTANRSTIIQTSPVHPGLCTQAEETFEKLYHKLIL